MGSNGKRRIAGLVTSLVIVCLALALSRRAPAAEPAPDGSCSNGCTDIHGNAVSCGAPMGSCATATGAPGGAPNADCQVGEQCDDGNTINGDGCDNNCTFTACGNGISTAGEECDNGANNNNINVGAGGNPCDTNCHLKVCGNGRVEGGEQCDDGDTLCDDDCDSCVNGSKGNCLFPGCGNGITDAFEACDDGNTVNGDGCDNNCTKTACGNGIVDPGEQCDDGNTVSGDGCDANCTVTGCGNGITTAGETCDDGNTVNGDGCDNNCTKPGCGNGITDAGEQCDDGNTVNGDACEGNCQLPRCGDGITDHGEFCDDGNTVSEVGGCPANCKTPVCGDGITQVGEQCDSGECVCDVFPTKFSFGRDCGSVDGRSDCQIDGGACVNSLKGGGFPTCSLFVNHISDTCVACGVAAGDGNSDYTSDACRDNCRLASCGDGVTDTGEGCDDGLIDPAGPEAGDDIDKCPNGPAAGALHLACKMANVCGDAFVKFPSATDPNCQGPLCAASVPDTQACDNGGGTIDTISGPLPASQTCHGNPLIRCADEVDCTDQGTVGPCGNSDTTPDACRSNCVPAHCGDGVTDSNEACDDGNTVDDPFCLHNCSLPGCGDGIKTPPEACDNGANNGVNEPCTDSCRVAVCGDGKTCSAAGCTSGPNGGPEQCDDGNLNDLDNCKNDCSANVCGDGVTHSSGTGPFEQCDDGNTNNFDGCSSGCCFEPGGNLPGGSQAMFSGQQCNLADLADEFAAAAHAAVASGSTPARVVNVLSSRVQLISKVVSQAQGVSLTLKHAGGAPNRRKLCRLQKRVETLLVSFQRTLDNAYLSHKISYGQYTDASSYRIDAVGFADQIRGMFFCPQ
ncbi:MAG: DUF4215 domain-containing protein [Candidatus Binatia bacterium]